MTFTRSLQKKNEEVTKISKFDSRFVNDGTQRIKVNQSPLLQPSMYVCVCISIYRDERKRDRAAIEMTSLS
uniref:Uncharacterized protein n=1 Tax=Noccaea caerulescens TaxID=107243 RepID=A0A1J3FQT1_NOCCA